MGLLRGFAVTAVLLSGCFFAARAEQGAGDKTNWGFSVSRLERVHEVIERHTEAGDIGGAVTLVARKGHLVYTDVQGMADIKAARPMRRDTIFVLASMTKPVTACALMTLVEEGKVRLSDPVAKFIPEFTNMQVLENGVAVPAKRQITIVDLLTHTSGHDILKPKESLPPRTGWPEPGDTLATFIPRLGAVKLDFQPGSRWSYSGVSGIDTVGRIVEIVSGMPLDKFFKTRLFEPLGMNTTYFVVPKSESSRVAVPYEYVDGKLTDIGLRRVNFPETYFSGSAGLLGTADDFMKFAQMLANGGILNGHRILSPRSVELMSSNYVGGMIEGNLGRGKGIGFGLTMEVVTDPALAYTYRSRGCYGWDGRFGTQFWIDPQKQVVVVSMVQSTVGWKVKPDVDTAIMQALTE